MENSTLDETQKDEKLKELEKSLAQELDPSIKKMDSASTSKAETSSVQVSGPPAPNNSGTAVASGSQPVGDVISLENLDAMPADEASVMTQSGGSPSAEPGNPASMGTPETARNPSPDPSRPSFGKRFVRGFVHALGAPVRFIEKSIDVFEDFRHGGFKKSLIWFKEFLQTSKVKYKAASIARKKRNEQRRKWFDALSLLKKVQLIALIAIVLGLLWYLKGLLTGDISVHFDQPNFVGNFQQVADKTETYDPAQPQESFDNPLRNPEYMVLMKRMAVTIKPGGDSGPRPMAMMELYLEASSQKTATELLDRERETRDIISRVVEELRYDEIVTESGKEKLKTLVRRDLNVFLNSGRVKKIYFKTFFYKP